MRIVDEEKGEAIGCALLTPSQIHQATGRLSTRILELLATNPNGLHAAEIARRLGEHEQKVYYHIRKLRDAKALVLDRIEDTAGAAAKVLRLSAPALATALSPLEQWVGSRAMKEGHASLLNPFIEKGSWNARIVVSSPDPHGPESARGRDAGYAIDLGLFLGLFLSSPPKEGMLFDTEVGEWRQNLIVIGGPVVNKAAAQLNDRRWYDTERKAFLVRGQAYAQDNVGVILKMRNPKAGGKWVLVLAGKRYTGTRAAILAFLQRFEELCALTEQDGSLSAVVEGLDADSDGNVESARILDRQV